MIETTPVKYLTPGVVHVWYAMPSAIQDTDRIKQFEQMLESDELESYQRLQQNEYRHEYLVSHALLRKALSYYVDRSPASWHFSQNEAGKPAIEGLPKIRFNLSHSNDMAVCAITVDQEVGIDVEYQANGESLIAVADQYFSNEELALLEKTTEADKTALFFQLWTLKEAYLKARGEGQSVPLPDLSFSFSQNDGVNFAAADSEESARWDFSLLSISEGYSAALALDGSIQSIQLIEGLRSDDGELFSKAV